MTTRKIQTRKSAPLNLLAHSNEAKGLLLEWPKILTRVIGQHRRDYRLSALLMLALGTSTELDANLCSLSLLLLSASFLVEVLIALKVALWLLKEVKVGLEHDEASIRCLSDQLILFHGQSAILSCCVAIFDEVCWVESLYDFEFALELTMTHLM